MFDKMQAQMDSMNLPGRLPAIERETEVPAFEIASKTDGYCGMCNVPGYVLRFPKERRKTECRRWRAHLSLTNGELTFNPSLIPNTRTARKVAGSAVARWRTTAPT